MAISITAAKKSHLTIASVAICEILFDLYRKKTKDKRKKADTQRSRTGNMYAHQNRRDDWCRIANARLEIGQMLRTDFCVQGCYSSIDNGWIPSFVGIPQSP